MALHSWIINSSHLLKRIQEAYCFQLPFVALQNDGIDHRCGAQKVKLHDKTADNDWVDVQTGTE
jgi:hypothetical protein